MGWRNLLLVRCKEKGRMKSGLFLFRRTAVYKITLFEMLDDSSVVHFIVE